MAVSRIPQSTTAKTMANTKQKEENKPTTHSAIPVPSSTIPVPKAFSTPKHIPDLKHACNHALLPTTPPLSAAVACPSCFRRNVESQIQHHNDHLDLALAQINGEMARALERVDELGSGAAKDAEGGNVDGLKAAWDRLTALTEQAEWIGERRRQGREKLRDVWINWYGCWQAGGADGR